MQIEYAKVSALGDRTDNQDRAAVVVAEDAGRGGDAVEATLDDQLWTYSPQTDHTIRISGHMLRQSVMGSDMSYEDMMEDSELATAYEAGI